MNLNNLNFYYSLTLFGYDSQFNNLIRLYQAQKFPKTLLFSGKKGQGKSTLVFHFLNYVFNQNGYNHEKKKIDKKSPIYNQIFNKTFANIIFINGDDTSEANIENIRKLRNLLSQSTMTNKHRFIVLNDIELFNNNCLNALLKIIEEPSTSNFFILINNETKKMSETISSRCHEIKIFMSNHERKNNTQKLIDLFGIINTFDYETTDITPGHFVIFSKISEEYNIDFDKNYIQNIEALLKLYKKNKDLNFISMANYLIELLAYKKLVAKNSNIEKINENKNTSLKDINNFVLYNLGQNTIINSISKRFTDD
tara:strand:+ start:950 stop:1882 length:933 start_codon:yes stop_codon:yes gene_type:complete